MELSELKKIFPRFSTDLLKEIEEHAVYKSFQSGDLIMKTGQYIRHTVLVLSGVIKTYREDEEGNEFFMYHLQSGQACAISMICATRSETSEIMAKVVEDAELILVPLSLMDKWMMQHRSWYEFVIETYRTRFEEILEVIDSIAFKAMDERLVYYLERHYNINKNSSIKVSHQEIANELNTSREVISRLLKKLEQKGKVILHRNYIEWVK